MTGTAGIITLQKSKDFGELPSFGNQGPASSWLSEEYWSSPNYALNDPNRSLAEERMEPVVRPRTLSIKFKGRDRSFDDSDGSLIAASDISLRPMTNLRCVYCHDDVRPGALDVANCPSCRVCFHTDCREQFSVKGQCPTLACAATQDGIWHSEPRAPKVNRPYSVWDTIMALASIVVSGLAILASCFLTILVTALVMAMGLWFASFESLEAMSFGFILTIGALVQAPFTFIYSSQWLYQKTLLRKQQS